MRLTALGVALMCAALVCEPATAQERDQFATIRASYHTAVHYASSAPDPMPAPPSPIFRRVNYQSPVGELGAYLSPDPGDGARHPAIIWMTGGETNTVGDVWSARPANNDQSAAAYRNAGIVMMFPSLRGGNNNPGQIEGFFGEIDDILAAAEFLAQQPYLDPDRIYLGGHSTGGTLVFLVAEASGRFRAVFAFGPVVDVREYGQEFIPFDFARAPPWETVLRAPGEWMPSVQSKLFVIEATDGNIEDLRFLRQHNTNPNISFIEVPETDHFGVLAPANEAIAQKILNDNGASTSISLTAADLTAIRRSR